MNTTVDVRQNEELLFSLAMLKNLREELESYKLQKKSFIDELEANPHYINAINSINELNQAIDERTEEAKKLAVEQYKANPEAGKKLANGNVTIRETESAEIIDIKAAFDWVSSNAPSMMIVDSKALLKHAKAVKDTIPLSFVEISKEPTATISSDIKFG